MKKKFAALLTMVMLTIAMFAVSVHAEVATDYTFSNGEAFDFCVYNIWAGDTGVTPTVATIKSITMTINVSDFSGEAISAKLYSREQATWITWATEAQTIDKDGTYTFYLDFAENAFDAEQLATIYVKDFRCCVAPDEDADGESLTDSGVSAHVTLDSVKFNQAPASDETTIAEASTSEAVKNDATTTSDKKEDTTNNTSAVSNNSVDFPFWIIPVCVVAVAAIVVVIVVFSKKK